MRLVAVLLVLAAACRGDSGGSRSVGVTAFAGTREEPGLRVIGHSPTGATIDETTTDGTGHAEVGVDDDSLVSVLFEAATIAVVTTPVPASGDIVVYGPAHVTAPLVVGSLQVSAPALANATYFEIELGCATIKATSLPAVVDVTSCSMGTDRELDVLVRGMNDAMQVVGYAAARLPMIDGVVDFVIASWETATTPIPVTLDGVSPTIELTFLSDGLPFASAQGDAWTGLVVDTTRVTATTASATAATITEEDIPAVPTAIRLGAADLLPPITLTTTRQGSTLSWDAASLGDAVNVRVVWGADREVVWNAVLPPDATSATPPDAVPYMESGLVLVRYVDSANLDGFAALVDAGIHAEETMRASTIAPRAAGELRISEAIGLR